VGFSLKTDEAKTEKQRYERMKDKVLDQVKKFFRPEFLNRVDAVIVFHALDQIHILHIVDLMLDEVRGELREKGIDLEITQAAKERLSELGYDPNFGARPLRRVIQNNLEDALSDEILSGKLTAGDTAIVDLREGEFVVEVSKVVLPST